MSTRLHLSLRTRDLDAAVAFYTRLLGEGPDKLREGYARFSPAEVPVVLSLMLGDAPGLDHLGVRHDALASTEASWARLASEGAEVREERGVGCCHAVQDKAWFHDPDGHAWEVYTVTDDAFPKRERDGCCA